MYIQVIITKTGLILAVFAQSLLVSSFCFMTFEEIKVNNESDRIIILYRA